MIDNFRGPYFFLSNFFHCSVLYEGRVWPSAEHAYQAAKTEDLVLRDMFLECQTAGDAKRLGRSIEPRSNWPAMKLAVMEDIVRAKFKGNEELKRRLLATGEEQLVEGNSWGDTFWGRYRREGENHLGQILMKVRKELQTRRD